MNEPRTLTEAINRCQVAIAALPWADLVLGRAQQQRQQQTGQDRPYLLPMIPGDKLGADYISGLPNDQYKSVMFWVATGREKSDFSREAPRGHQANHIIRARRSVALIGWANLQKLGADWSDGSGFAELLKFDLKTCLKKVGCVSDIHEYTDTPLDEVFAPFQVGQLDGKYDRLPYVVFRLDLTLHLVENPRPQPVVAVPEPLPEPAPAPEPTPEPIPISTD